jgi:hypothetical protein
MSREKQTIWLNNAAMGGGMHAYLQTTCVTTIVDALSAAVRPPPLERSNRHSGLWDVTLELFTVLKGKKLIGKRVLHNPIRRLPDSQNQIRFTAKLDTGDSGGEPAMC